VLEGWIPDSCEALGEARCPGAHRPESVPFLLPPTSGHGKISLGESFWAAGDFAETVGQVNEEVVKKYIRQQLRRP